MSIVNEFKFIGQDERQRKYILPESVSMIGGTVYNVDSLLVEKPLQIGLNEPDVTTLENGADGEKAYVVLDFGKEIHGGIRLLCFSAVGTAYPHVRLTFGESLSEVFSTVGEKGQTNDHAVRDMIVPVPSYSDQEWGQTGFRFVKVELQDANAKLLFKTIPAVFIYRDIPYIGKFECDDPKINKIFETAVYTCHLNLQNYVWDGIKRDRLVWIGDMHPEMLTTRSIFGPLDIVPRSLDFAKGQTPLPQYMNDMAAYSMWWLLIVRDYYYYTGDEKFIESEKDYFLELLKIFCDKVNDDGTDTIGNYFVDWPTHDKTKAEISGVRSLLRIALQSGAEIAEHFGREKLAETARYKADVLLKISGEHEGQKQVAAFMSMAGMLSLEECEKVIKASGEKGLSSYLLFYTLKELAKSDSESALELLKNYSYGMLDKGATTFWEDFDPSWAENTGNITELPSDGLDDIHGDRGAYCYIGFRHSFCHGWASGAVPFLMEEIMGVHIVEKGCKKLVISPKMSGLKYIKGTYPTPYGPVDIHLEMKNEKVVSNIKAPREIEVLVKNAE